MNVHQTLACLDVVRASMDSTNGSATATNHIMGTLVNKVPITPVLDWAKVYQLYLRQHSRRIRKKHTGKGAIMIIIIIKNNYDIVIANMYFSLSGH